MKTKYIVGVIVLLVGLYWWFNRKPEQQAITPGGTVKGGQGPVIDSAGNVYQTAQLPGILVGLNLQ